MQGFEMLLYGTNNPLYDTATNKWEDAGAGWTATLNFYKTIYSQGLALSPQTELSSTIGTDDRWAAAPAEQAGHRPGRQLGVQRLLGQGRLYPWANWSKVIAGPAMPTENGQGGGLGEHVRRLAAVGRFARRQQADGVQLHQHRPGLQNSLYYDIGAGQIATRDDVAAAPCYKDANASVVDLLELRALHPLPPGFHRLPQTLQRDPAGHGPGHDRPGHSRPGRGHATTSTWSALVGQVGTNRHQCESRRPAAASAVPRWDSLFRRSFGQRPRPSPPVTRGLAGHLGRSRIGSAYPIGHRNEPCRPWQMAWGR